MATINISLDRRSTNANGQHPIRVWIRNANTSASIFTGVSATEQQFDGRDPAHTVTANTPNARTINEGLLKIYTELQQLSLDLVGNGRRNLTAKEIKKIFEKRMLVTDAEQDGVTFTQHFSELAHKKGSGKHAQTFKYADDWLQKFHAAPLEFAEIDFKFLQRFDEFMRENGLAANTRGIIFRNIRTTFNDAINNELTTNYPFRKFKIPHAQKEKEYLLLDDFRRLLNYHPPKYGQQVAKDLFLLSFYFCGANPIDLFNMQAAHNGRIKFVRTKTQSKSQSTIKIKIQPEAAEIISKYNTADGHLLDWCNNYLNYENFYHFIGKKVRELSTALSIEGLSLYWARYTWATYASRVGVDESVIGRALGHAPSSLAGRVYITFDWERVDAANRKVIDYLKWG